eukprot:TRINITY_DN13314_c0_g1_i2.p1 TRINITY_DN13314_c0_g1~~TRINITY_DN13314_c0_g1_i2.p1  ORF type:complete len:335 (+),score=76.40 TRINITY_DN13314_c0_g1_i2:73-1077(+)
MPTQGKPRVVFRVMEGAESLGLRALRREFGQYGEVTCACLRADSARLPSTVEVEFADSKATLRVKGWTGEGSHLPLYRPEGLVDAFRRDADAAFLCYADNFDSQRVNSFRDLAHFAQYVTDWCSATCLSCSLLWSPVRGVYAQMECAQKADQERVIGKLMQELYRDKRLSVSSVCGGDYAGVSEKSYRVDWSVVASEAAHLGLERAEGERLLKRAKKDKMRSKKDKKKNKQKKAKKEKKQLKKEQKAQRDKQTKKKADCKKAPTEESSDSEKEFLWEKEDAGQAERRQRSASSSPASAPKRQKPPSKVPAGKKPMAALAEEEAAASSSSGGSGS